MFHKVISGSGNFFLHDTRQDVCPNLLLLVVHQIKINKNVWELESKQNWSIPLALLLFSVKYVQYVISGLGNFTYMYIL